MPKHLNSKQAIEYINTRLNKPWTNPKRTMAYHLEKANIAPIAERKKGTLLKFDKGELKRFIKWLNRTPGKYRKEISPALIRKLGKIPDSEIVRRAAQDNESDNVQRHWVARKRAALGIPSARSAKKKNKRTSKKRG